MINQQLNEFKAFISLKIICQTVIFCNAYLSDAKAMFEVVVWIILVALTDAQKKHLQRCPWDFPSSDYPQIVVHVPKQVSQINKEDVPKIS